jgi:hypothetical protein
MWGWEAKVLLKGLGASRLQPILRKTCVNCVAAARLLPRFLELPGFCVAGVCKGFGDSVSDDIVKQGRAAVSRAYP